MHPRKSYFFLTPLIFRVTPAGAGAVADIGPMLLRLYTNEPRDIRRLWTIHVSDLLPSDSKVVANRGERIACHSQVSNHSRFLLQHFLTI